MNLDDLPLIILNKIDYYIWRIKQRELCHEYHTRIVTTYQTISFTCRYILFDNECYNYRSKNDPYCSIFIYNKKCVIVASLPVNYYEYKYNNY